MADDWTRTVATTIKNYVRGEEVNVLRNRKFLALMKEKGRITFNWGGLKVNWRVRYKQAPLRTIADAGTTDFPAQERWKEAELGWRGYVVTDSITKGERLKNKGKEAIIRVFTEIPTLLMEEIQEQFHLEFYADGEASPTRLHGVESFFAAAAGSASVNFVLPDDTYAGLDTDNAAYGGTWTGTWPNGTGDAHYDFWSPILVNWSSTGFGTASPSNTWALNATRAIRYGITKSQRNKGARGMTDIVLLENELWRQFLDLIETKERIIVQREGSPMWKLGFRDSVNWDGTDVTWEFGVPDNTGYGLNMDDLELRSQQPTLFVPETSFAHSAFADRFSIDFYGNMTGNPRSQFKLKNYA